MTQLNDYDHKEIDKDLIAVLGKLLKMFTYIIFRGVGTGVRVCVIFS